MKRLRHDYSPIKKEAKKGHFFVAEELRLSQCVRQSLIPQALASARPCVPSSLPSFLSGKFTSATALTADEDESGKVGVTKSGVGAPDEISLD